MTPEPKLEVGGLIRMRRDIKPSKNRLLTDGFLFRVKEIGPRGVTLLDTGVDCDDEIAARRIARKHLEPLPKKKVIVRAWNDGDDEEDYSHMHQGFYWDLTDRRGIEVDFRKPSRPQDALREKTDVYVIDYGGMGALGAVDMVYSVLRGVLKLVQEKPNTLVVIWTSFTGRYYQGVVEEELGSMIDHPNVAYRDGRFGSWDFDSDREKYNQALDVWFGEAVLDSSFNRIEKGAKS